MLSCGRVTDDRHSTLIQAWLTQRMAEEPEVSVVVVDALFHCAVQGLALMMRDNISEIRITCHRNDDIYQKKNGTHFQCRRVLHNAI